MSGYVPEHDLTYRIQAIPEPVSALVAGAMGLVCAGRARRDR